MEILKEKEELLKVCADLVAQRVVSAQKALKDYAEQEGEETKSSAGDKYETARAMIHLEKEKVASQLSEALKLQKVIQQIKLSGNEALGTLIKTNQLNFFIAVSLGQVTVAGKNYMVISPVAPLAKVLLAAKAGEEVSFNGRKYLVQTLD